MTAKIRVLIAKDEKAVVEGAYDYLIKTDWTLEEVVEKVNQKL